VAKGCLRGMSRQALEALEQSRNRLSRNVNPATNVPVFFWRVRYPHG